MPLFKGAGHKSTPNKVINYITNPTKAAIITTNALDDERNYAEQFKETAKLYNKGNKFDERKYYHFKLSCAQSENATPEQSHKLAEELVQNLFSEHECVIATHTDTETTHTHVVFNSVNFNTGKKYHCNNAAYAALKDKANELGVLNGFSSLDWREPSKDHITTAERQIQLKGGTSWKEELREVITEALQQSTNFNDFQKHLEKYGVTLSRNTEKTISFIHPDKQKAIRGEKLGQNFTKGAITNVINQQRNRTTSPTKNTITNLNTANATTNSNTSISPINRYKENRSRKYTTKRSIIGVERNIRAITTAIKTFSPTGRDELRQRAQSQQEEDIRIAKQNRSIQKQQRAIKSKYENSNDEFERWNKKRNSKRSKQRLTRKPKSTKQRNKKTTRLRKINIIKNKRKLVKIQISTRQILWIWLHKNFSVLGRLYFKLTYFFNVSLCVIYQINWILRKIHKKIKTKN